LAVRKGYCIVSSEYFPTKNVIEDYLKGKRDIHGFLIRKLIKNIIGRTLIMKAVSM